MAEQQTCGEGLAQNSPLPRGFAEVVEGIAANLEAHMTALGSDDDARKERQAYEELAAQHRDVAERLKEIAKQMANYRDLPMSKHDQKAMGDGKLGETFESLVNSERELLELLTDKVDREQKMLEGLAASAKTSN